MDNKYDKFVHRLALSASVSVFFVFTFLFYGPLKLYVENKDVLWFDFTSVLSATSVISVVALLIVVLFASIPKRFIHAGLCCLIFACALGLFIQGNFLNIDYGSGVLDGSEIAWKDYTTYGAIDSAVWAACLAMPFAFYMVFRTQWRKVLIFSSLVLVVVQAVILSVLISNNSSNLNKVTYEVTREGIYELSEDDNTIVFVLDSFDDDYLDKIKKAVPDYKKKLSGFTEYDNTLASASGASIALPSILTGEVYTHQSTYNNYIEKIWSSDNVYSTLNKNKVDTRIFAQTEYFSADSKDYVDNIVDYMDTTGAETSMLKTIYKYTAYTYMPHYLKEYFWLNLETISSYKSKNIYSLNDAKFYADYVRAEGFTYTDQYTDSVRIYNLDGARSPYLLTKNTIKSINGTSLDEQIYGCFNCIFTMLDDLKENGKYKDSNIIITANIGNTNLTQHPLMLIKKAGEDENYTISHAPLSSFDLAPTLASFVTDDYSAFGSGVSFFDVKEDDERERFFYLNTGENDITRIDTYSTTSDATDLRNLWVVAKHYPQATNDPYELGTSLTFTIDATANAYTTEGFCATTGWRTPIAGPKAQMVVPIKDIPSDAQDIHVFFGIHIIDKESDCKIYANNKLVFSQKITNKFKTDGLNFTIPKTAIGEDNTVTLEFVFDEISKDELKLDTNKRTKTFSVQSFKMYTQ